MLGAIIGAAVGVGSQIFNGISQAKARKRQAEAQRAQERREQAWYDRAYNEDATRRADAQRLLRQTEESIRLRNERAEGVSAVAGGSPEAAAAAREQNNRALAATASSIAASGEARRDGVAEKHLRAMGGFDDRTAARSAARQQQETAATLGVGQIAGTVGSSLDEWFSRNKKGGAQS